jgi:hypothetical protein
VGSILTVLCFYLGCSRFASICCFRAVEETKLFVDCSVLLLSLRLSNGGVEEAPPSVVDTPLLIHPTRPWPSLTLPVVLTLRHVSVPNVPPSLHCSVPAQPWPGTFSRILRIFPDLLQELSLVAATRNGGSKSEEMQRISKNAPDKLAWQNDAV